MNFGDFLHDYFTLSCLYKHSADSGHILPNVIL